MKAEFTIWIDRSRATHECNVTLDGEPEEVLKVTEAMMKHFGEDKIT